LSLVILSFARVLVIKVKILELFLKTRSMLPAASFLVSALWSDNKFKASELFSCLF
jgi:hypothetical protein